VIHRFEEDGFDTLDFTMLLELRELVETAIPWHFCRLVGA
jgi:hypothetical protein